MAKENVIIVKRQECCRIEGAEKLDGIGKLLAGETEVFVVYDNNVAWVVEKLGKTVKGFIAIEADEEQKSIDTVMAICRSLMDAGASRKALLLAIGGGITTDLAGFAAAIYKRGIRYANVPTTLLSQVDAAIGGKTGVNLDDYKNMLGAIVQPQFTFICAECLRTLPSREFRAGLAEMMKAFLLADADAYSAAVRLFSSPNQAEEKLTPWILRAAQIKAGIVQEDPFEKGKRALLNLGHSFAHAIEHNAREKGDDISHGEAVAIGIILAARLSEGIGLAKKGLAAQLKEDFTALGLQTESPYPLEGLADALEKDKKGEGGKINFIFLKAIGEPFIKEITVAQALEKLQGK